ncbi:MAG TPA: pyridoxal-dependent decarboxylase [Acidimicrobiales bacterium]|nr:pyridoxal-dependent decarboxylase [Acidimicrobiales bacterium]
MDATDGAAHWTPDDLRRYGHAAVEWAARYLETLEARPVTSEVEPGWVRDQLPPSPPEAPEAFEDLLADLDRVVTPALSHWQHPGWFAYFPTGASGPSVLADLISSTLGVQGMLWSTSPAVTELETHVLDWMAELLGLPERFRSTAAGGGVIQDSASSATLCALVAARWRAAGDGPFDRLRVYTSGQAHSSVEKAVRVAGLHPDQLRLVDVDDAFAARPEHLAELMAADAAAGLVPTLVVANLGTTSSTALDPVGAMADVAAEHGAWLHVDGAHAGAHLLLPELRWIADGLDRADSFCMNPHKRLLTNFDCDCFWVADRQPLVAALSVLPEYLRNAATESGAVIDYRDWQIPLGRRFRALKLWFVIRSYGAEGLRRHVRHQTALAQDLAARIAAHPRLELSAPHPLDLVCFHHVDGDEASEALLTRLNATGRVFLTHTRLDGRFVLRVAVGTQATEARHVDALWALIDELA